MAPNEVGTDAIVLGSFSEKHPQSHEASSVQEQSSQEAELGAGPQPGRGNYLKGWPLHVLMVALSIAVFLPSLESTIVATSLVAITDSLHGFSKSSWIITSYLLTYEGFLIIWAKLSDIFGRKLLLITSLSIFIIFSAVCGGAHDIDQLIIIRAFQGIGGAGTYSLVFVIFYELVPPEKYASMTGIVSAFLAIGLLLGPILGGVINNFTTWKWVFWMCACAGAFVMILILLTLPNNFPYHGLPKSTHLTFRQSFSRKQINRVDFLGTALFLAANILLVTVFEEAGTAYPWKSAFVIVLLIIAFLCWVAFFLWSWKLTESNGSREPVFPWRFMQSRVRMALLLCVFLTGAPLTISIIQIPLRYQIVNGLSPLNAGVRLLPFIAFVPVGSSITSAIVGRKTVPFLYMLLFGSALQTVGVALLSTTRTSVNISHAEYGYQVITGFGIGCCLAAITVMTPFTVEKRDQAVAMSAVLQFRLMGGAIGLAVVTTVMNSYLKSHLAAVLSPAQLSAVLVTSNISGLSPDLKTIVKVIFAKGYDLQMKVAIGFSAAQIPVALCMWQRPQVKG